MNYVYTPLVMNRKDTVDSNYTRIFKFAIHMNIMNLSQFSLPNLTVLKVKSLEIF